MKRFWRNCKGAVTVIVTLLLIPAVLVSGSAVDFSRIYSAKSVLQDANQLAANSALASYDAILQDLYGLYGIMQSDSELASLIDKYIQVSVLGDAPDQGLGTWQLFYGSNVKGSIQTEPTKALGNPDVLRRQIEEYAKFRAPVIIVDEILDRLDNFKKVQEDSKIIKDKIEVDDGIEDLMDDYKKVYRQIGKVNGCIHDVEAAKSEIDGLLERIHNQFWTTSTNSGLYNIQCKYTAFLREQSELAEADRDPLAEEKKEDMRERYSGVLKNIKALISGGTIRKNWQDGTEQEDGSWEKGKFQDIGEVVDLGLEDALTYWESIIKKYNSELDKLKEYCETANNNKREVSEKLSQLETNLGTEDNHSCTDDLYKGLTEKAENDESILDTYKKLLQYNILDMGVAVRGQDRPVVEGVAAALDAGGFGYGDQEDRDPMLSLQHMKTLSSDAKYSISYAWENRNTAGFTNPLERLAELGFESFCSLKNIDAFKLFFDSHNGYKIFQDHCFDSTKNAEFYAMLEELFSGSDREVKKDEAKSSLKKIFEMAKDLLEGLADYDPKGAHKIPSSYMPGTGSTDFGDSNLMEQDEWNEDNTQEALDNTSLFEKLGQIGGEIADYILLLTYDGEMFSNWATEGRREDGKIEKTMTGQELNVNNNYLYQSEMEFLFAGNDTAQSNLATVSGMILLVRFVFNYVASFSVSSVKQLVQIVRDACAVISPFNVVIAELVRMALALGESAMDLSRLRSGHGVAIYKKNNTWKFSVEGLANMVGDSLSVSASTQNAKDQDDPLDDSGAVMYYEDYLRIFMMFVGGDNLTKRTQSLIEMNLTYKKAGIDGSLSPEEKYSALAAAEKFDLNKANTTFTITTTADLRMLFLSMPMAQNANVGASPPGKVRVSATDMRGY